MPKCFIVDVEVGSKYASVSIMLLKYWFLDGDVICSKQITGIMVSMIDSKFGKKAMVKRKLLRYSTKISLLDKFDLSSIDGSAYLDVPYAMKFFCQKGNGGKPLLHNFVSIFFLHLHLHLHLQRVTYLHIKIYLQKMHISYCCYCLRKWLQVKSRIWSIMHKMMSKAATPEPVLELLVWKWKKSCSSNFCTCLWHKLICTNFKFMQLF